MSAKNKVIAGDYEGKIVFNEIKHISISLRMFKSIPITKDTVESYEVVNEESRTSAVSAVGRGLVGSLILGPAGLAAALSAKKKGIHTVAIQFKDGKRSLLALDDKLYNILTRTLF